MLKGTGVISVIKKGDGRMSWFGIDFMAVDGA